MERVQKLVAFGLAFRPVCAKNSSGPSIVALVSDREDKRDGTTEGQTGRVSR